MPKRGFVVASAFEVSGALIGRERVADVQSWKRVLDVSVALAAIMFLAPLLAVISLLTWSLSRGPIFYAQERVGRDGRLFRCLKFRTMSIDADEVLAAVLASDPAARAEWVALHKLKRDPRVTPLGRFLRRTSMDELPQLFNVLLGDMSLVGPRPIVPHEITKYGRYFPEYLAVNPGLTGLWQVSGRNNTSYRRRVACDVVYSRNSCLHLDLRILLLTIKVVLRGEGY
jgi:exopolysaccharide production protein ExoY